MKWYYYVIIGGALLLAIILVCFLNIRSERNRQRKIIDNYYQNILNAVGGKENIISVSATGSRLSFILKDNQLLNSDLLNEIHITGVVRSSKKTTLVVGEMASQYADSINKELTQE